MRFVNTGNFIDLIGVYREFKRTVYEEIDFVTEAANCKRFKEMFKDDPTIYIPRVYEEYSSRRVLVLEWIDGIKINDYAALEAVGIDRLEVANRTVQAYFHQFFEEGFFHADPHPGNIFVKQGTPGNGPIIEFVDFGMVGSITSSMKQSDERTVSEFCDTRFGDDGPGIISVWVLSAKEQILVLSSVASPSCSSSFTA